MLLDALIFGPWSLLILLPGLLLGVYAQIKVSSTYSKYSKIRSKLGVSGSMAAREMLNKSEIYDVSISAISGNLTDNYNPQTDVVSLSQSTYNNTSVAAIGVAAHEIGHVMQQKSNYFPIKLRTAI
ncbi:MAG: zinc metallopeptidase, partial [Clostridia bacterium]|nr:zinc metallopeptidase [Clostridia bacterium]